MTHETPWGDPLAYLSVPVRTSERNRIKAAAALRGQSMRDYVLTAVFKEMGEEPPTVPVRRRTRVHRPRASDVLTASVRAFIKSECRTGLPAGYFVESAALRNAFAAHPYGQDHPNLSPVAFGRALARACTGVGSDRARVNGRNAHVYRGICLISELDRFQ